MLASAPRSLVSAALPLWLLAACHAPPSAEPTPASAALPELIPWVDPARCVRPCDGPALDTLVAIDPQGRAHAGGSLRVRREVQPALEALLRLAHESGVALRISHAYRSHADQHAAFLRSDAIGHFARPGHSEHELGLAVDLDYEGDTPPDLLSRAPEFGFLQSYPAGHEHRTGFRAEPWHLRFVGPTLARRLAAQRITLQDYLEANPALATSGDCSDCVSSLARAPCDGLPARCEGAVLRWCLAGAQAAVDCSLTGARCDPHALRCLP